MSKVDIQSIVDTGEKLRKAFLEAQAKWQACKKPYDAAHAAYSAWVKQYGALEKVLIKMKEGSK